MNNEPVAELVLEQMAVGDASSLRVKWLVDNYPPVGTKLYTHPVELTDEEMDTIVRDFFGEVDSFYDFRLVIRRCIRKAQEKCNGFCGEYECKENQSICKRKAQET